MRLTPIEITAIKVCLICLLWMLLEWIFYKEVQPRTVDDIIAMFLIYYIYKGEVMGT